MDYNLKYLKYKNKYINLKNMIGNGIQKMTDQLVSYLHEQQIDKSVFKLIYSENDTREMDKARAKSLMNLLKDIKDKKLLSNLISNIFYYNTKDEEIKTIMENLFTQDNDFGINDIQERYRLLNSFLYDFLNSDGTYKGTESVLRILFNFTQDQFYILKKLINIDEYRNNIAKYLIIYRIREIDFNQSTNDNQDKDEILANLINKLNCISSCYNNCNTKCQLKCNKECINL
jgi:hypothetical protein